MKAITGFDDQIFVEESFDECDFRYGYLRETQFIRCSFKYCLFYQTYFYRNVFVNCRFKECNFYRAKLNGVTGFPEHVIPLVPPSHGEFTAWKRVQESVVKLLIPEDAKRSSATTRKCRASHAIVLSGVGYSSWDTTFYYEPGKRVVADNWDPCRWNECSGGIHFFITKEEAENYHVS